MKIWLYTLCPILLLNACDNEVGGKISYAHSATLKCPQAYALPADIASQMGQYPKGTVMYNFYHHYLDQQNALASYHQLPESEFNHCPDPFWAPDDVALEFKNYPDGSSMRQFFNTYASQQRAIDAYYTPGK